MDKSVVIDRHFISSRFPEDLLGKVHPKEMQIAIVLIDHLTTSFRRSSHPKTQEPKISTIHDIMMFLQNGLEKEKRSKSKKRKLS